MGWGAFLADCIRQSPLVLKVFFVQAGGSVFPAADINGQPASVQHGVCASGAGRCYISYVQASAAVSAGRTKPNDRISNELKFITSPALWANGT